MSITNGQFLFLLVIAASTGFWIGYLLARLQLYAVARRVGTWAIKARWFKALDEDEMVKVSNEAGASERHYYASLVMSQLYRLGGPYAPAPSEKGWQGLLAQADKDYAIKTASWNKSRDNQ